MVKTIVFATALTASACTTKRQAGIGVAVGAGLALPGTLLVADPPGEDYAELAPRLVGIGMVVVGGVVLLTSLAVLANAEH